MNQIERAKIILKNLNKIYPKTPIPLKHKNTFTLLVSVALSAQTTDLNVNNVTKDIYKKYYKPIHFVKLGRKRIEMLIKRIGLFRNKAKSVYMLSKQLIDKHGGKVPKNFQDLEKGLKESFRVLNIDGTLIILETSVPENRIIKFLYSIFTRTYIPIIARIFSKDKSAYNYLLNSAEFFPSGIKFCNILKSVGFADILIKPMLFGSSTIYVCKKQ